MLDEPAGEETYDRWEVVKARDSGSGVPETPWDINGSFDDKETQSERQGGEETKRHTRTVRVRKGLK